MLSISIRRINDYSAEAVAHVQIARRNGDDDSSYRWVIESNGEVVEGQLDNFERSRGPLELLWQVLSLYMINKENRDMVDDWFEALLTISVEKPG